MLAALLWNGFGMTHAADIGQGVFTSAQAARGKAVYTANCAQCHQPDLSGRDPPIPALTGDIFLSRWTGHSLAELFERVSTTMPQAKPGSLSKTEYIDAIAFVLAANGFPVGKAALKPDPAILQGIQITAQH